jgi:hypothetical protein
VDFCSTRSSLHSADSDCEATWCSVNKCLWIFAPQGSSLHSADCEATWRSVNKFLWIFAPQGHLSIQLIVKLLCFCGFFAPKWWVSVPTSFVIFTGYSAVLGSRKSKLRVRNRNQLLTQTYVVFTDVYNPRTGML